MEKRRKEGENSRRMKNRNRKEWKQVADRGREWRGGV
jgi:hypothetical protein